MRNLVHRLGCLVQLGATALAAWALHAQLGWGTLWSLVAAVPAGMAGTLVVMLAANLLMDQLGVD